jgi:phospholipase C
MAAETMLGFLEEQENAFGTTNLTRAGEALIYLSEAHIPVYRTIAENFVLFSIGGSPMSLALPILTGNYR